MIFDIYLNNMLFIINIYLKFDIII